MKYVLWAIFFLSALPALGSVSYVQGGTPATGIAQTVSCSTTGSVAAGDLLVVTTKYAASTSGSLLSVASSSGPTVSWIESTSQPWNNTGGQFNSAIAWGTAPTSGTETAAITWSGSVSAGFVDCTISEFSSTLGFNFPAIDIQLATISPFSSLTCAPGTTGTTSFATELVVAVCFNFDAAQTYGTVSGYTFQSASSRNTTAFYWASVSSTGAQTISVPLSATDEWTGFILTFGATGAIAAQPRGKEVMF